MITTDASSVFTSTSDFAEEITYYPKQKFGESVPTPRTINAVVFREQFQSLDDDTNSPVWQIHVVNDDTLGISSTELNLGGDQIALPPRDGQDAARRTITYLQTQDHGMLVLECR